MSRSGREPLNLTAREPWASLSPRVVHAEAGAFAGLDDPRLLEFIRTGGGMESATGQTVNVEAALRNPAMFRALSLVSYAIGMLPLQLIREETKEKATDHPLYRVLHREPNSWQTAFDFRSLMQLRAMAKGDGIALIVRGLGMRRGQVQMMVPLDPDKVTPEQGPDWVVRYKYQRPDGGSVTYAPEEIFHLRGLSLDGIRGLSLVKQAREAIGLAIAAELAAARMFKNGAFVGGGLKHPGKLSPEAYDRLKASLADRQGADNAGKNVILEEGMEWIAMSANARDAQMTELRKLQVEEIARVTGVPRPLLMVDETSWGSGIEALGNFFVQYALNPWFEAWQQAAERSLLVGDEKDELSIKFNPGALLRGSLKDQAEFFAKALGAGGQPAWMTVNEVRDLSDMSAHGDGDKLNPGSMGKPQGGSNAA